MFPSVHSSYDRRLCALGAGGPARYNEAGVRQRPSPCSVLRIEKNTANSDGSGEGIATGLVARLLGFII